MSNPNQISEKHSVTPIQDIYSIQEAAALLCISRNKVYELAKRSDDPLPVRRLKGYQRSSIVIREELIEWAKRNFDFIGGR